ncbi:MAG: BamA/TamA family outer membrane protein, partial [Pseudomonadota bacterium]
DLVTGDALGGTIYASATAEVTFPFFFLPEELGLRGAVFADAGILTEPGSTDFGVLGTLPECTSRAPALPATGCFVDENSVRASVGFGLLWDSPFGPIRADVGFPILSEDFDEEELVRFGAGTRF